MNGKADLLPWSIYRQVVGRMVKEQWMRRTETMWRRCMVGRGGVVVFLCIGWEGFPGKAAWVSEGRKYYVFGVQSAIKSGSISKILIWR